MEFPQTTNPAARASANRVQALTKSVTAFDTTDHNSDARALQAARICKRFAVSLPLALTVAALAYDCGRVAR